MRILIIHYRYSVIGGPERYLFNVKKALEDKGHHVIPFSISYPENESSEYESYFVQPLNNQFHLHEQSFSMLESLKVAKEMIYNKSAYQSLKNLIEDSNPDIAYVLIYKGKLSYSIFNACHEKKVPVVLRISSFGHFCGKATLFRDGNICDLCVSKPISIIKHKCMHKSIPYSLVSYLINRFERWSGSLKNIKEVICPSYFTSKIFQQDDQFKDITITHLPTFQDNSSFHLTPAVVDRRFKERRICYIGRIVEEKGLEVLIHAIKKLENDQNQVQFLIAGFSESKYSDHIRALIIDLGLNEKIICKEFLAKEEIYEIMKSSMFSIIPSIWYDNMPNSLIEAQSFGLPVIATDIGSLKELVRNNTNGWLFKYKDSDDLADKITFASNISKEEYWSMSQNSIEWVSDYSSKEKHIQKLEKIFHKYI